MLRKAASSVILVLLVTSMLSVGFRIQPAQGGVDWWPTFQHDLSRSGYSTSSAPNTANLVWQASEPEIQYGSETGVVTCNGVIIATDWGGPWVTAIDEASGAKIWKHTFSAPSWMMRGTPSTDSNLVYVVTDGGPTAGVAAILHALSFADGHEVWSQNIGPSNTYADSPAISQSHNIVVVGSATDPSKLGFATVWAFDKTTGAMQWYFNATPYGSFPSSAAIDDANGRVYIASGYSDGAYTASRLYCLDLATGHQLYDYTFQRAILQTSTPTIYNGNVYYLYGASGYGGGLHCFDANLNQLWYTQLSFWQYYGAPAVAYGRVFTGQDCVDASHGNLIWHIDYMPGGALKTASPSIADGKMYIENANGFCCYNASDGTLIWSYPATGDTDGTAAITNGKVYFTCHAYRGLYAFGPSSQQTYFVSFSESGLAQGTQWSVTFNGQTQGSTSNSIIFNAANGVYAFSITPPSGYTTSPSSGSINVTGAAVTEPITFSSGSVYTVTINAHCNNEGADVSVSITVDGSSSGHNTAYTFPGLTGSHSFTVPDTDPSGHPFAYWDSASGVRSREMFTGGDGTHIAYYQELPEAPQNVVATPSSSEIDLTWTQLTPPSGYTVEWYYIYRGTTPNFSISWSNPYGICGAVTTQFHDTIQDDNIYYYKVVADFQQCFGTPSTSVGCARLQSLKGVANEITGVDTLSVPQWWESITIQQNFFICTGGQNPQYYWCQNAVEKSMNFPYHECGIMQIWGPVANVGQKPGKELKKYDEPNLLGSRVWKIPSHDDKIVFISYIEGQYLVMQNTYWNRLDWYLGWTKFDLGLAPDARIHTITENYGLTNPLGSSPTTNFPPNLVVVGHPDGGDAKFTGGKGSVSSLVEFGSTWMKGKNIALVSLDNVDHTNSSAVTTESSHNLIWHSDGSFSQQTGGIDEGVFFVPDLALQSVPEPQVDYFATLESAITLSLMCPVYLNVYDYAGRFIGFNATSGEVESQIPTALWMSNQSIVIFDPNGTYSINVTGTDNGTFTSEISWQGVTGASAMIANFTAAITENETQVYAVGANANVTMMNILPSKTVIGRGFSMQVNATVANLGGPNATFDVSLYANNTLIGTQSALNISGWDSMIASFAWNTTGLAYGNYTPCAFAANSNCTGGNVVVTIPGDINGDFAVGLSDLGKLAKAYNSHGPNYHHQGEPASPSWNPNSDINNDGIVNLSDLGIMAKHYNQHYP